MFLSYWLVWGRLIRNSVDIDDEVIEEIHKRANRFRQIVKILTQIENLAKSEGFTKITKDELGW